MKCINFCLIFIIAGFSVICEARSCLNSDPCNAILLENDLQICASTVGAGATISPDLLPCPSLSSNQIWFKVLLPPNQSNIQIQTEWGTLTGFIQLVVGQWTDGCNGDFQFHAVNSFCSRPSELISIPCLSPGEYFILISSANTGAGDVCLTTRTFETPGECSQNNNCTSATFIDLSTAFLQSVCISGCNVGACRDDFELPVCSKSASTVWYSFQMPSGFQQLNISLNSPDKSLFSPQIVIFEGNCNDLNPINSCQIGANGKLDIYGLNLQSNKTYFMSVGNYFGSPGTFDICLIAYNYVTACQTQSEIRPYYTSKGSPIQGPYLPGERVEFVFTFDFTSANNGVQWPHAVIPQAGQGWDLSTLHFKDRGAGNWQWVDEGIVTYNTFNQFVHKYAGDDGQRRLCFWNEPNCHGTMLQPDDYMPGGWYHLNQPGQCDADLTNPNNTWGQPCGASCTITIGFSLQTQQLESCISDPALLDCSLQFFVFSDFQTGCWLTGGENTCGADSPTYFQSSLQCCKGPEIDTLRTEICSGVPVEFVIASDQDDMVASYEWKVSYFEPGLSGATAGEGLIFSQNITNTSSQIREIDFKVTGKNLEGCRGTSSIFTFVVHPQFEPTLHTVPENLCGELFQDIFVQIAGGGGGPYTYDWDNPDIVDSIQLGVTYPNYGTYTHQVTVTDVSSGCQNSIFKEVYVGPGIEINFDLLKLSYCYQEDPVLLSATPADGQWVSLTPGLLNEQNIFDLKQISETGIYLFEYGLEDGPCIYQDTIGIFVNTSARDCPDTSVETHTDGTEVPFTGTINTLPFLTDLTENTEVRIFDTLGKELYYSKNYQNDWNADKYPAGLYFFIVTIEGKTYRRVVSLIK